MDRPGVCTTPIKGFNQNINGWLLVMQRFNEGIAKTAEKGVEEGEE